MTEISAAMVKQLRDATSAGMMDCKRALVETEGDFDAAVKLLREKGMASAAKRADRETTEGVVLVTADADTATIVAGKLGENIQVVGATRMTATDGEAFTSYVHPPANKVGVLVESKGGSPELA